MTKVWRNSSAIGYPCLMRWKGCSHTDTPLTALLLSSFAPLPWILSSVWVAVFIAELLYAEKKQRMFWLTWDLLSWDGSALRVSMLVSSCLERRYRKLVNGTAVSSARGQGTMLFLLRMPWEAEGCPSPRTNKAALGSLCEAGLLSYLWG